MALQQLTAGQAIAHRVSTAVLAAPLRLRQPLASTRRCVRVCAEGKQEHSHQEASGSQEAAAGPLPSSATASGGGDSLDVAKELTKFSRQAAGTFAPRASTPAKANPAPRGSTLYNVFEVQAWLALVVGGLLSFNVLFPTDDPSIPRLIGMWSIWMFTIPSLRARDCVPKEKDALNALFLLVPLLNVLLPFVWKSFPFIFCADAVTLVGVYYVQGVWQEVYGLQLPGGEASQK